MSKEFLIQLGSYRHEKQICPSSSASNVLVSPGKIVLGLQQIPRSERDLTKANIFLVLSPF